MHGIQGWMNCPCYKSHQSEITGEICKVKGPKEKSRNPFWAQAHPFFCQHLYQYIDIYINSIEIPFSPNFPTGGLAPIHQLYVHCSNNQPKNQPCTPPMPPDHDPCAIPTATCPQLCQLVPNLVAHNLSETRTLKDRKWCFFHGLRYANGQHNICQKHETFCPVRKTMIKTMMSTFDWKVVKGLLGVIKRLQTVGAIDAKRHATIEGETHESGGSSQATNMLLKTSMP